MIFCKAIPPNWIKIMKGKLQPPSNKSISMDRIPVDKLSSKLATNLRGNLFLPPPKKD